MNVLTNVAPCESVWMRERKPMLFFVGDAASLKADAKRCVEQ